MPMTSNDDVGIRNDVSRYEAVSLALVEMADGNLGALLPTYPADDSPLRLEQFFETLYLRYDERFVYAAADIKSVTQRLEWAPESPAFQTDQDYPNIDYSLRCSE